jgi:hypothetical protein
MRVEGERCRTWAYAQTILSRTRCHGDRRAAATPLQQCCAAKESGLDECWRKEISMEGDAEIVAHRVPVEKGHLSTDKLSLRP